MSGGGNGGTSRVLHITQAGQRPRLVGLAPEADPPLSKRDAIFDRENENLERNLADLEEGTRARNREFQHKLDELWSGLGGWEAKLRTEATEAEESVIHIRQHYQKHIDAFSADMDQRLTAIFDRIDHDLIPPQFSRLDVLRADTDVFFQKTVPDVIERQSGEVSRQLKKQYETFDIEKQKAQKKEAKFVARANAHIQNTAQRMRDESALLRATLYTLEEEIAELDQRDARTRDKRVADTTQGVVELRRRLGGVVEVRGAEDNDILDTVIETQKLLQQTVLEHFGGSGDNAADGGSTQALRGKIELSLHSLAGRRASRAAQLSAGDVGVGGSSRATGTATGTATGAAGGGGGNSSGSSVSGESKEGGRAEAKSNKR